MLDPTHTATSLGVNQLIQVARAEGMEVALAFSGISWDVLFKANVVQSAVPRPHRGGVSPFPCRCGSTLVGSAASGSFYSLQTIIEVAEQASVVDGPQGDAGERERLRFYGPSGAANAVGQLNGECPKIC